MVPMANTPTAMEAMTSRLRALLSHRSASTLRQRGLSTMGASLRRLGRGGLSIDDPPVGQRHDA